MIEMVATRGYEASTVVELCALAGSPSGRCMSRFPGGTQECFLATYSLVEALDAGPEARARTERTTRRLQEGGWSTG
jgi:hypothetical protein